MSLTNSHKTQFVRFFLLLISLFLVACSTTQAGDGQPDASSSMELDRPPLIQLVVDGETIQGAQGSYCWQGGSDEPALCVDMMPATFEESVLISAETTVQLQFDTLLPDGASFNLMNPTTRETIANGSLTPENMMALDISAEAGDYLLMVSGSWAQGDGSYLFSVSFE